MLKIAVFELQKKKFFPDSKLDYSGPLHVVNDCSNYSEIIVKLQWENKHSENLQFLQWKG